MPAPMPRCRRHRSVQMASRCAAVPGLNAPPTGAPGGPFRRQRLRQRPRPRPPIPSQARGTHGAEIRRSAKKVRWTTTTCGELLSLAAIEAELKPKVLETSRYRRQRMRLRLRIGITENRLRNQSLSPAQERKYKKLKEEIITAVKSLRLHQARIDAWSNSSTISTSASSATRAVSCARKPSRFARGFPAQLSGPNSIRAGSIASQALGQGLEEFRRQARTIRTFVANPCARRRDRP